MENYSQAGQDIFAYYLSGQINDGYFLDIGCQDPININNTYLLEQKGWRGILFDINKEYVDKCLKIRKSKSILTNLEVDDINVFLEENDTPKVIDYISMDIDSSTEILCRKFPWDEYKFKIMTFEHDIWQVGDRLQKYSRTLFEGLGYVLVCANVKNSSPYEDWWINPEFIDEKLYEDLVCSNTEWKYIIEKIDI